MRNPSLLVLGLGALTLPILSAFTAPSNERLREELAGSSLSVSRGIETQQFEDGSILKIDKTGKGAVLCVWQIYEAVRAVSRQCHDGEDVAFREELDNSLNRIDSFIIKNSKTRVTEVDLASERARGLEELKSSGDICKGDAARMYDALHGQGSAMLRANTRKLLSIPREPVLAPCL